jgi:hypothetical protein
MIGDENSDHGMVDGAPVATGVDTYARDGRVRDGGLSAVRQDPGARSQLAVVVAKSWPALAGNRAALARRRAREHGQPDSWSSNVTSCVTAREKIRRSVCAAIRSAGVRRLP